MASLVTMKSTMRSLLMKHRILQRNGQVSLDCFWMIQKALALGVFFDDVQVLREESFGNGFGIGELPYLLRENIRNTANIYNWTAEKTNLGTDMVANPVEGPTTYDRNC